VAHKGQTRRNKRRRGGRGAGKTDTEDYWGLILSTQSIQGIVVKVAWCRGSEGGTGEGVATETPYERNSSAVKEKKKRAPKEGEKRGGDGRKRKGSRGSAPKRQREWPTCLSHSQGPWKDLSGVQWLGREKGGTGVILGGIRLGQKSPGSDKETGELVKLRDKKGRKDSDSAKPADKQY